MYEPDRVKSVIPVGSSLELDRPIARVVQEFAPDLYRMFCFNCEVMNDQTIDYAFPKRRNIRLRGYDYSLLGAYFITICTHNKQCLFGTIGKGTMNLNPYGKIVRECWINIPQHYIGINSNVFIVMPNHIHGVIEIRGEETRSGSKPDPTKRHPLSEIVRAFKTYSSRGINELRDSHGTKVWQSGYYEHIIRGETDYREIGDYIIFNPAKWESDSENPVRLK